MYNFNLFGACLTCNNAFFRQKRVRFPKGKKVKTGDERPSVSVDEDGLSELADPRLAAKERAKRRNQMTAELFREETHGIFHDVSSAEVTYEVCFSFFPHVFPRY
uniref:Uncharacterized protein n=1 Tax=Nelumbo nucifera TaxID=4432 RepID=A0A822ZDP8_NELNU|nr:TPA_asm: hypothetical protein HUJ06_015469 [Nelumbo nucifera]